MANYEYTEDKAEQEKWMREMISELGNKSDPPYELSLGKSATLAYTFFIKQRFPEDFKPLSGILDNTGDWIDIEDFRVTYFAMPHCDYPEKKVPAIRIDNDYSGCTIITDQPDVIQMYMEMEP